MVANVLWLPSTSVSGDNPDAHEGRPVSAKGLSVRPVQTSQGQGAATCSRDAEEPPDRNLRVLSLLVVRDVVRRAEVAGNTLPLDVR